MGAGQTPGERGVIALYTVTLSVPGGLGAGPCSEVDVKTEGGRTYYMEFNACISVFFSSFGYVLHYDVC